MVQLSYSGQKTAETNPSQEAHDLLDALLAVENQDEPITVDTGQVRPRGDTLLLIVSLSAEAPMETLQSVQDSLATELVNLGVEPDATTAKDAITVSG